MRNEEVNVHYERDACKDPQHLPPQELPPLAPGSYEWICPSCGLRTVFYTTQPIYRTTTRCGMIKL